MASEGALRKVAEPITVAKLILEYLALEGVDHLFGVPGGALMNLCNELKEQRERFNYIVCRQESGAAYIADGYARISGGLGVVAITAGPGATNALTGAMNAQASGTPMLVISGEAPVQYFGLGYLQEGIDARLDVKEIYEHAVAFSAVVTSAASAQTLCGEALRAALSVPGQVAHISVPDDVAGSPVLHALPGRTELTPFSEEAAGHLPCTPASYRSVPPFGQPGNGEGVRRAFELLTAAERPLILVGNGCRRALQDGGLRHLSDFVERHAIPVMTTPEAKALFPETHPLSLRNWGIGYCEWPQYWMGQDRFDALLILGSALGELATAKWSPLMVPAGPAIQVDLSPAALGRAYPIDVGIVADVGRFLEELSRFAATTGPDAEGVRARRDAVGAIREDHSPFFDPEKRDSDASPIKPQALMRCINDALPKDAHVFVDSGNCYGWAVHHLVLDPPATFNIALNMGPMGVGVCAVIGGKIAAPDRTCVAIVGDGAFLMQGSEVSTAARYGVGAIWVVLNDNDLAMVSQGMNVFFPDAEAWNRYYDLGAPDLVRYSEGLGADACRVTSPAEMDAAFTRAILAADAERKPQVIVAEIDRSEIPPYYQKPRV